MKKNIIFLILVVFFISSCSSSYKADEGVTDMFVSDSISENLNIVQDGKLTFFDGPGIDSLLIFIPGGKVSHKAYAPILCKFAQAGIDSVLVKVPMDLAILNTSCAEPALKKYSEEYQTVYLGGHSLGGAVASMYAPKALKRYSNLKGLFLLAAYSTNSCDSNDFKILSVRGSNDGVLQMDKYEKYMSKAGPFSELIIEGGNHAMFGNYGEQKGDGEGSVTAEDQQSQTVQFFLDNYLP